MPSLVAAERLRPHGHHGPDNVPHPDVYLLAHWLIPRMSMTGALRGCSQLEISFTDPKYFRLAYR